MNTRWGPARLSLRVLAKIIDFVFLSPFLFLLLHPWVREAKVLLTLMPDSRELMMLLVLMGVAVVLLVSFTMAFFWAMWGATPGQKALHLRVAKLGDPTRLLTFYEALQRAFAWFGMVGLGAWPFLEQHAFHDRINNSIVVSAGAELASSTSLAFAESLGLRILQTAGFAAWLLVISVWMSQTYLNIEKRNYRAGAVTPSEVLCVQEVPAQTKDRLQISILKFWLGSLSESCLEKEIDYAYWKEESTEKAWAHFAKAKLNEYDTDKFQRYQRQLCADGSGEFACQLLKNSANLPIEVLEHSPVGLWLRMQQAWNLADHETWFRGFAAIKNYLEDGEVFALYLQGLAMEERWQDFHAALKMLETTNSSAELQMAMLQVCDRQVRAGNCEENQLACQNLKRAVGERERLPTPIWESRREVLIVEGELCRGQKPELLAKEWRPTGAILENYRDLVQARLRQAQGKAENLQKIINQVSEQDAFFKFYVARLVGEGSALPRLSEAVESP